MMETYLDHILKAETKEKQNALIQECINGYSSLLASFVQATPHDDLPFFVAAWDMIRTQFPNLMGDNIMAAAEEIKSHCTAVVITGRPKHGPPG